MEFLGEIEWFEWLGLYVIGGIGWAHYFRVEWERAEKGRPLPGFAVFMLAANWPFLLIAVWTTGRLKRVNRLP